jgi:hypothetical protein
MRASRVRVPYAVSPALTGLQVVPRPQAPVTVSIVSGTRIRRWVIGRIVQ